MDGTEPTLASPLYSAPFSVGEALTVKAVAHSPGWTSSDATYASYWITDGTVATPTIAPVAGAYSTARLVTLSSATASATIRYTLDGSDPTETSPVYRFGFVVSTTTTVKARAFKAGMIASAVASTAYALDAAGATLTPTVTPDGGRFTVRQTVAVQGPAGATFRYTLDGRDPVDTDPAVGPEHTIVVDRSQVLKVRAWQSGLVPSAVRSAFFVITGQVSAGDRHTLALKTDGTVWSWGYNFYGALGDGTNSNRLLPVQASITDVKALATGYNHSLALKRDGTVWAWGDNLCGQLGIGSTTDQWTPVQVPGLTNVIAIAAGGATVALVHSHSLALKADGTVWAWGCNQSGQVGDGTMTSPRKSPVQVTGLQGVTAIAAGGLQSYAVVGVGAAAGTVWAWGNNGSQELGDGSTTPRSVPVRVVGMSGATGIAATRWGAIAARGDGTVWGWGFPSISGMPETPAQVPFLERIVSIAAGAGTAFAIGADEIRWGWGDNYYGQFGNGQSFVSWAGTVAALASGRVREIAPATLQASVGGAHTVLARVDGTLAATGRNAAGQLGNGGTTDSTVPVVVPGFSLADNAWLASDADNDGLTAWREWLAGTDPYRFDTNGNGIPDGLEELAGPNSPNPDTDADGLTNWDELQLGTDPFVADSDGDTVLDCLDAFPLDPTRSTLPPPTPGDTTPPVITLTEPTTARPVGGGGGG